MFGQQDINGAAGSDTIDGAANDSYLDNLSSDDGQAPTTTGGASTAGPTVTPSSSPFGPSPITPPAGLSLGSPSPAATTPFGDQDSSNPTPGAVDTNTDNSVAPTGTDNSAVADLEATSDNQTIDQDNTDNGGDSPADDNPSTDQATPADAGDLLSIKQNALTDLSPLLDHLDQAPEEQFRTTMMLIQATDNQELIKEAYAAAQKITDEKIKAQALLDVINEINYFSQKNGQ